MNILAFLGSFLTLPWIFAAEGPAVNKAEVCFQAGDQKNIPARYRLDDHKFSYELTHRRTLPVAGVESFDLRFPSPVTTKYPENNTVHAEYYRPIKKGKFPGVVVLDITGGDQTLSRVIARHLAQNEVCGLFVQMAYYGPRRPPGGKVKLLSTDIPQTFEGIRQTVLDLRRASAWLESRPEVDPKKLGIMGTSLGSFVAALTGEMEPRFGRVCVLLGGGDFVEGYWDHPQAKPYREVFETFGGRKNMVKQFIAPIDPITHAATLKERRLLIVAAKNDEIVPPRMAEILWNASGRQDLVWLNAGHYSAALYLITGLNTVVDHFKKD